MTAEQPPAHRQARLAWWLLIAVMAAGGLLVAAALVTASTARLELPTADRLIDTCRSLLPRIGLRPAIELVVAATGFSVTVRAVSGALVELRGLRRYRAAVATSRPARLGRTDVWILDDDRPLAFTGGWLHPRIHISTASQRYLAPDELAAVLAHEDHHRRQRDPLRMAVSRVLSRTLAFIPGLGALADRHERTIELAADEAAAHTANPEALAGALLRLGIAAHGDPGLDVCGIAPERVDRLAGRPTSRLGTGHAVLLLLGAMALSIVAAESLESARTTPVEVALAAAQLCSAGGLGLALTILVTALRRRSPEAARSR